MVFLDQAPNFHFKRRESCKSAQKSNDYSKTHIIANVEFIGKEHKQKAEQKRAGDVYKKRREREFFKPRLQRRNVDEISRDSAESAAECN